jgi:Immunity protein 35
MIDRDTATAIARRHLEREFPDGGVALDHRATMETARCWVLTYNTEAYLRTGELRDCLVGNGPLLVDKRSGALRQAGTAHPVEHYLASDRDAPG